GQELAERFGVLEQRRLDRIEAVTLVDAADGRDHAVDRRDVGRGAILEPARQASLDQGCAVSHATGVPKVAPFLVETDFRDKKSRILWFSGGGIPLQPREPPKCAGSANRRACVQQVTARTGASGCRR